MVITRILLVSILGIIPTYILIRRIFDLLQWTTGSEKIQVRIKRNFVSIFGLNLQLIEEMK
jgi:hypothetical protein